MFKDPRFTTKQLLISLLAFAGFIIITITLSIKSIISFEKGELGKSGSPKVLSEQGLNQVPFFLSPPQSQDQSLKSFDFESNKVKFKIFVKKAQVLKLNINFSCNTITCISDLQDHIRTLNAVLTEKPNLKISKTLIHEKSLSKESKTKIESIIKKVSNRILKAIKTKSRVENVQIVDIIDGL